MVYEIERKNDLSGAMLVIRFPEEELDKKAFYTIENDQPPFLIPFSYRSVDRMAECTYHLGSRSKLQYRFGTHNVNDYIDLWTKILQPLLDCDDWFMKPFSFVLDSNYLYVDKSGTVRYLYVPTISDCESLDTLRAFMVELSQQNNVTDAALENKVLRHIMQDVQPKAFLAMLRASGSSPKVSVAEEGPQEKKTGFLPEHLLPREEEAKSNIEEALQAEDVSKQREIREDDGEIHINLNGNSRIKTEKEKPIKEKKSFFGGKKEKVAKVRKPLFGKKEKSKEVMLGAAAEVPLKEQPPVVSGRRMPPPAVSYDLENPDEVTQLDDIEAEGVCRLRLVGAANMPREIVVEIQPGRAFTIGRFDISVGHRQSDFEFDKSTKAVSRRHAAIEHEDDGYYVVDLASSAGTFVDGIRLIPNVPQLIANGSRISFGTGGADYVWTE